jgi:phosphotriesterase-related protein
MFLALHDVSSFIKNLLMLLYAEFERRAIQATGEVQAELGCPVSFHSGRHPDAPFEIIRLFQEAGGDVRKAVMSHLESKFISFPLVEFYTYHYRCM